MRLSEEIVDETHSLQLEKLYRWTNNKFQYCQVSRSIIFDQIADKYRNIPAQSQRIKKWVSVLIILFIFPYFPSAGDLFKTFLSSSMQW